MKDSQYYLLSTVEKVRILHFLVEQRLDAPDLKRGERNYDELRVCSSLFSFRNFVLLRT